MKQAASIEERVAAHWPELFGELRRVLGNGSRFGIYDVVLTGKGDLSFPLSCVLTPETSFIVGVEDYRRGLEAAGFVVESQRDRRGFACELFRQVLARVAADGGPRPPGIHIPLKRKAPNILANVVGPVDRGVTAPVENICRAR